MLNFSPYTGFLSQTCFCRLDVFVLCVMLLFCDDTLKRGVKVYVVWLVHLRCVLFFLCLVGCEVVPCVLGVAVRSLGVSGL